MKDPRLMVLVLLLVGGIASRAFSPRLFSHEICRAVPGIDAAVDLSSTQHRQITILYREFLNAGDADARSEVVYRSRCSRILTASQQKMIDAIEDATARAVTETDAECDRRFATALGGGADQIRKIYREKQLKIRVAKAVLGFLGPEQLAAVSRAAAAEQEALSGEFVPEPVVLKNMWVFDDEPTPVRNPATAKKNGNDRPGKSAAPVAKMKREEKPAVRQPATKSKQRQKKERVGGIGDSSGNLLGTQRQVGGFENDPTENMLGRRYKVGGLDTDTTVERVGTVPKGFETKVKERLNQ